jgi:hypothetical protein
MDALVFYLAVFACLGIFALPVLIVLFCLTSKEDNFVNAAPLAVLVCLGTYASWLELAKYLRAAVPWIGLCIWIWIAGGYFLRKAQILNAWLVWGLVSISAGMLIACLALGSEILAYPEFRLSTFFR